MWPVLLGHPHHLGDHQQRQGRRQVLHDVHAALFLSGVEEFFHRVDDKGAPRLHGPGREVAMDHLAHLQVHRTVVLDELVGLVVLDVLVQSQVRFVDVWIGRPGIVFEHGIREQLVVSGHPYHVVVPGKHPQSVFFVPVDRVFCSETTIVGIGVSDNVLAKHIIVDRSNSHNPFLPRQQCVIQRFPRSNPCIRWGSLSLDRRYSNNFLNEEHSNNFGPPVKRYS